MYKWLKWIRVAIALVFLVLITISLTFLSRDMGKLVEILNFQFVPSLISFFSGGAIIFIFFIVLNLLFGRAYCSLFCPLGILQDIVSRVANLFKSKKKRAAKYTKPHTVLRYTLLIVAILAIVLGFLDVSIALDSYSNYGRITTQIFDTAFISVLNGLSNIFPDSIFYRQIYIVWGSFAYAALFLLLIVVMSAWKGRLYCNTICPVGTFMGVISKVSLFKLTIDESKCVGCGICTKNCKSGCIDGKNHLIDETRCVVCLNCTTVCHGNAIRFVPRWKVQEPAKGRREAIATISALGGLLVVRGLMGKPKNIIDKQKKQITGIVPPGGVSIDHLKANCSACYACIAACPNRIISPAVGEYGIDDLLLPVVHYKKQFCGFNCNKCSQACPNGALKPLTLEQKRRTQIGRVKFTAKNCVVFKDGTLCGACDEHCPTKAITMKEISGRNGLNYPVVNPDICIGCGACEYICPATPKAMHIVPLNIHGISQAPTDDRQEEKTVTDFGF